MKVAKSINRKLLKSDLIIEIVVNKDIKKFQHIEELEKRYFDEIVFFIEKNIDWFLARLKSKNEIKKDWLGIFKSTSRTKYENSSELDTGAERVIHNMFGQYRPFSVNSSPIGSDLMFETPDSFIHIEIKTATDSNNADFKGKIQISQNQTSYSVNKSSRGVDYPFKASLPQIYSNGKLCLTYVIQIIYNNNEDTPKIITLFSIPNGRLSSIYNNCINSGKGKRELNRLGSKKDIRFLYKKAKIFENLESKPSRISVIHPKNPSEDLLKKYLDLDRL